MIITISEDVSVQSLLGFISKLNHFVQSSLVQPKRGLLYNTGECFNTPEVVKF